MPYYTILFYTTLYTIGYGFGEFKDHLKIQEGPMSRVATADAGLARPSPCAVLLAGCSAAAGQDPISVA
eukprot:15566684-Heterocapsa_arctica.AAC.1